MNLKPLFLLLACLSSPWVVFAQDPPTTDTLLGDARLIITSNKGDVRLWSHPPRVLVLYESDSDVVPLLEDLRLTLEQAIDPYFGEKLFGNWTYHELPDDLGAGSAPMYMRFPKSGPAGRELEVRLGERQVWKTDIVIAIAKRRNIALLNAMWGLVGANNRAMMRGGKSNCFYSSKSKNGVRLGAYVTIALYPHVNDGLKECIWEELAHSLGPLTDAQDSEFFTFDNLSQPDRKKKANDLLLLKALYESGARPGDHPDIVLNHLKSLISGDEAHREMEEIIGKHLR